MQELAEINREKLIAECGRSIACIKAVEYYTQQLLNPCYPPSIKLTSAVHKYLMQLVSKYGSPRCDIKQLVYKKLSGTQLAHLADEAAEVAAKIRRELNLSSRVAAALAVYLVARGKNIYVSVTYLTNLFNISGSSISSNLSSAVKVLLGQK